MRKVLGILFLATLLTIAQNKYAGMSNVANADFNGNLARIDDQPNLFGSFLKLHDDNASNQINKFMIKGTITASSSNSLTINNQAINIDSSVTGNVKIVGNVQTGMYAMVQGIIQNSNYYATKIVVDQRNKNENREENEENENATPTITPTGTITPTETVSPTTTLTPTPTGTQSANIDESENINGTVSAGLNFGSIIEAVQNFLNYIKNVASTI